MTRAMIFLAVGACVCATGCDDLGVPGGVGAATGSLTAAPRPVPEPAPAAPEPAGLAERDVASVVQQNRGTLSRCTEGDEPSAAVRMDVHLSVAPDGAVTGVRVQGRSDRIAACVENTVEAWEFPAAERSTSTTFPVVVQGG